MLNWEQLIVGPSVGLRMRYPELRLGIELEFERFQGDYPHLDYWHCERDASLRNGGVEYISAPLTVDDITEALAEVQTSIDCEELEATWRCGGHTHINVMYWTYKQLITYTVMYALMEPHIFGTFAPGRETNHFCVPLYANTDLIDKLATDAITLRGGAILNAAHLNMFTCNKYSALNFKPARTLGTIEFRHIPGTTKMEEIKRWCTFLTRSVEYARTFDSPEAVIARYEDHGPVHMITELGLHTCEVPEDVSEDAYIAANMIVGHDPRHWRDIDWKAPDMGPQCEPILRFEDQMEQERLEQLALERELEEERDFEEEEY